MPARAWIVLCRDVSDSIHINGQDEVWLSLVLDADTGLALGTIPGACQQEALEGGCRAAAASTLVDAPSAGRPAQVWTRTTLVPAVTTAVGAALPDPPPVIASGVIAEAEDIFDSLVQTLRGQPLVTDPPSIEQWQVLYDELARFAARQPWQRWDDDEPVQIELTVDGEQSGWTAVVMGSAGIQLGLAVYPGRQVPAALTDPTGAVEDAVIPGSYLVFYDEADELPTEAIDKALRHHWPDELEIFPHCIHIDEAAALCAVDATSATVLLGLLSAVRRHDERCEAGPRRVSVTRGQLTGSRGERVRFVARHLTRSG